MHKLLAFLICILFLAALAAFARLETHTPTPSGVEEWRREVLAVAGRYGVPQALELVRKKSQADSHYEANCHDLMHVLGRVAYEAYRSGRHVVITPQATLCAFGFYHGFMETWIGTGDDPKKAVDFCAMVDRELAKTGKSSYYQCWHGIGHGAVAPHEARLWGNRDAVSSAGVLLCKKVAGAPEQLSNCLRGVWGGIAMFMMEGRYGFNMIGVDPNSICLRRADEEQEACVSGMVPVVFKQSGHDMIKTWEVLKGLGDEQLLLTAANALGSTAGLERIADDRIKAGCAVMDSPYVEACSMGYQSVR